MAGLIPNRRKQKESSAVHPAADDFSMMLEEILRGYHLVGNKVSRHKWNVEFTRLLEKHPEADIRTVIDWLRTNRPGRDYVPTVHSAASFCEKYHLLVERCIRDGVLPDYAEAAEIRRQDAILRSVEQYTAMHGVSQKDLWAAETKPVWFAQWQMHFSDMPQFRLENLPDEIEEVIDFGDGIETRGYDWAEMCHEVALEVTVAKEQKNFLPQSERLEGIKRICQHEGH